MTLLYISFADLNDKATNSNIHFNPYIAGFLQVNVPFLELSIIILEMSRCELQVVRGCSDYMDVQVCPDQCM